jgi:hypothetical protein
MLNRTLLRVGTDVENATAFNADPLRTLLFGFRTEFVYLSNFWQIDSTGTKLVKRTKSFFTSVRNVTISKVPLTLWPAW